MPWTNQQTRAQYLAIAQLRWRMFLNGFRRKSTSAAASIVAWIIITPVALLVLGGVCALAFATAFACIKTNHLPLLSLVYSGIFLLTLLANIQLGQPGTTFDPTQLIRFPLKAQQYTYIRLFFGVLSPGNIAVVLMSLSAAAGILVIQPKLWLYAVVASLAFAVANVLFTRMLFSWVDRWLATRRAREIFTAFLFLIGMGFQYWNIHYNIGGHHRHHHSEDAGDADDQASDAAMQARVEQMQKLGHYIHVLDIVPSGMAAEVVETGAAQKPALAAAYAVGTLAWAAAFFAIFSVRMRTEFRGENLSDVANAVATPATTTKIRNAPAPASLAAPVPLATSGNQLQPTRETVTALLQKELLYLRRNTGLLYGLVAPLVMVVIFATTRFARGSGQTWMFPAALAYAMLGVLPVNFNSFGFDGIGVQTYFLTPVSMRDVLLAKNLFNTGLALVEIVVILGLVSYLAGFPPVLIVVSVLLWAAATLFIELTVGNFQSISSPRRIDPGRTAQKQARPLSALLSMAIMLAMAGIGFALMWLSQTMPDLAWILPLTMLILTGVSGAVYWHNLKGMDIYAMRHRDSLFEEMSRKA